MCRLPAVSSKNAFSSNFEAGKYDLHTAPKPASPSNDSEYDTVAKKFFSDWIRNLHILVDSGTNV